MAESRRGVSREEQAIVGWLLEHAATDAASPSLSGTISTLEVVDRCDCGCPSVDFVREGQGAGAQILAEAVATGLDGLPMELLLWGRDGKISGLEVYNYDGGSWFPLPPIDHLRPCTRAAV